MLIVQNIFKGFRSFTEGRQVEVHPDFFIIFHNVARRKGGILQSGRLPKIIFSKSLKFPVSRGKANFKLIIQMHDNLSITASTLSGATVFKVSGSFQANSQQLEQLESKLEEYYESWNNLSFDELSVAEAAKLIKTDGWEFIHPNRFSEVLRYIEQNQSDEWHLTGALQYVTQNCSDRITRDGLQTSLEILDRALTSHKNKIGMFVESFAHCVLADRYRENNDWIKVKLGELVLKHGLANKTEFESSKKMFLKIAMYAAVADETETSLPDD